MYRILIADDEAIIREGIKCLFDYESLGYTICAEADTGDEAYEKMIALNPDVVLMDIRMPGLSGLEAVSKARQHGFRGKVVIVTSYADFQYAKEAIRCDVQHYITKPIDEDELEQIFLEFRYSLEQDQTSMEYFRKAHDAVIADLLLGKIAADTCPQEPELESDLYQTVICSPFDPEEPISSESVSDILRFSGISSNAFEIVALAGDQVILLKGDATIGKFREALARFERSSEVIGVSRSPLDTLFVTYGAPVDSLNESAQSYRQAKELQSRRFFCTDQHVLGYDELARRSDACPILDAQFLQKHTDTLLNYLQTFNRNMIAETLQELQDQLSGSADSIDSIRLFFSDLYLQIKEQMNRLYVGNEPPFYSNTLIIQSFQQARTLNDIILFLSQRFNMIMSAIGTSSRDSVLDDIMHYIRHNYTSNITLESIAPLFGYNHSYLGKIFRKKTGCSFNVYVDHIRIEKAKELLLQDDAKVYAIAERVGYKNVDYFHVKFRKYVNQSPAEFRKNNK